MFTLLCRAHVSVEHAPYCTIISSTPVRSYEFGSFEDASWTTRRSEYTAVDHTSNSHGRVCVCGEIPTNAETCLLGLGRSTSVDTTRSFRTIDLFFTDLPPKTALHSLPAPLFKTEKCCVCVTDCAQLHVRTAGCAITSVLGCVLACWLNRSRVCSLSERYSGRKARGLRDRTFGAIPGKVNQSAIRTSCVVPVFFWSAFHTQGTYFTFTASTRDRERGYNQRPTEQRGVVKSGAGAREGFPVDYKSIVGVR